MSTLGGMTYRTVKGGYSGYASETESTVIPLLGKDPAWTGPAEAIQSSATRAEVATLEIWCENMDIRDQFLALNQTQVVHEVTSEGEDSGESGGISRDVTVMSAKARVGIWSQGNPWWIVAFVLRTYMPSESNSGS